MAGVSTNNSGVGFGVLTDTGIKSASVKLPKFKWNPKGVIKQTLGDFQVRYLAQVIAAPATHVIAAASADAAIVASNSVTFPSTATLPTGLAAGSVMVSGGGTGFVYHVVSVTTNADHSIQLTTTPASLADAIQQGSLSESYSFQPADLTYAATGVTVKASARRLSNAAALKRTFPLAARLN